MFLIIYLALQNAKIYDYDNKSENYRTDHSPRVKRRDKTLK